MTPNELQLDLRNEDGVAVLDLRGEINALAERTLSEGYAQAERSGASAILLNFEDVDYINSTGIALIVSLLARARASHRRLLACGLSAHYVEIFNITRLADFMTVFPNETAALSGDTEEADLTSEGSKTA